MTDSVASTAFREALSHFASGVTIIAAHGPAGRAGFTATGFASVSLTPPLILVCVGKKASAYDGIVGADAFSVSILEEQQRWVAERFATQNVDRFEGVPVREGQATSAPLIAGALVQLECRHFARHDAGDHTLLLGHVVGVTLGTGRPLLHYSRRFGAFDAEGLAPDAAALERAAGGQSV